jgi:hypothetical protein
VIVEEATVTPDLSRRLARAVNMARLPATRNDAVAAAAEDATRFEELPEWVRDLVVEAERDAAGQHAVSRSDGRLR